MLVNKWANTSIMSFLSNRGQQKNALGMEFSRLDEGKKYGEEKTNMWDPRSHFSLHSCVENWKERRE